jgi:hypothetical protein
MKHLLSLGALLGVLLYTHGLSAQATDPLIGTWKLNVEKSKFDPGPGPKSATVKFEAAGQGIKVTTDGVSADGKSTHTEYTASFDGKDYPITGSPTADTVALKRIDASTTERTDKKGGKVVATLTRKVDPTGKVLTITVKGTNAEGKPVSNTMVYEKQ